MDNELTLRHKSEDDRDRGLYGKYLVIKRSSDEVLWRCFVLRYDQDPFAIPALTAYADACAERYPKLAEDIRGIVANETERQERLRQSLHRLEVLDAEGTLPQIDPNPFGSR